MKRTLTSILILALLAGATFAANELRIDYATGATIVAAVTNDAGQWWDTAGAAFETYNTLTDYDIAMTDAGGGSYRGTMPSVTAGVYTIKFYSGTTHIATEYNYNWSGSAKLYTPVDVQTVEGDIVSDSADLAAAVWDAQTSLHATAGTTGAAVADAKTAAEAVQTQVGVAGAGLTAIGDARMANLDASISGGRVITTVAAGTTTASTFVMTAGPAGDAYFSGRYWWVTVVDATSGMPDGAVVSAYVGSTKTLSLETPLTFTPEIGDTVYVMPMPAQPKWSR